MSMRTVLVVMAAFALSACAGAPAVSKKSSLPPIRHVFVIMLENQAYENTFRDDTQAPYLAHELVKQGALLENYYGVGHYSLDNYLAMISGQAPNPATQHDCRVFSDFARTSPGLDANGQASGEGCVYPPDVKTLPDQLEKARYTWKGYMQDMGADPARESATCGHVAIGATDVTNHSSPRDQYADKHDPFVYFHSIIDDVSRCRHHVVNLDALDADLTSVSSTPNFAYIVPNLCDDGHDAPCITGEPGGLVSADRFLQRWVPKILDSPAFRRDGLLIVTFDEGIDAKACCGEQPLPNGPQPGGIGPGGGRIGAVMLSPYIKPATVSSREYNHYAFLRSIEDIFGLPHLGYAAPDAVHAFGDDIFNAANR